MHLSYYKNIILNYLSITLLAFSPEPSSNIRVFLGYPAALRGPTSWLRFRDKHSPVPEIRGWILVNILLSLSILGVLCPHSGGGSEMNMEMG